MFALNNVDLWIGDGDGYTGHIIISDGTIEAIGKGPAPAGVAREELEGMSLSPGLIDLMVLGGFGRSILRDDPLEIAREYLRLGVTSCQLCIGTLPWESMEQVARNTARSMAAADSKGTEVLGLYLEGPFQQPDHTGASLREYALDPTPENVQRILDMGDAVTMVNVSPGIPGDIAAIKMLRQSGKVVSMAHSNAPAEAIYPCLEAGTSVLGHVWDNNSGLKGDSGVQQPTIEHVALTDDRIRLIHLICDGKHVHPTMIKLVLRARGIPSVTSATELMPRAGCPDGEFVWDDGRTFAKRDGVGRTEEGWLAGSGLLLPDMLRNFVRFTGLSPREAIQTVTRNPAASLALDDRGLLAPGRRADLVAWDSKLRARRVWREGEEIDNVSDWAEVTL